MTLDPAFIFAVSSAGDFGMNGQLPWPHNPFDFAHFRAITMGQMLLVGRKTADTLPPLPGRDIAVLTRSREKYFNTDRYYLNLNEALLAAKTRQQRLVVGGGVEVLTSMNQDIAIKTAYITIIKGSYPSDTRFDLAKWLLVGRWQSKNRQMSPDKQTTIYTCERP